MITIPAGQVTAGQVPQICARHGEQPIEMKRIRFISKPPPWAAFLIVLGGIVYAIVVAATRKKIEAPAWPWCAQCKAQRSRSFTIGLGIAGVGILLFFVAVATIDSDAGPLLFLVGLVALIAGIIVAARGAYQAVTGAVVSQNGQYLELHKEHQRFVQALGWGAQQAVPQQQNWGYDAAPQQPQPPQQQRY
jgi:hypothetical protein